MIAANGGTYLEKLRQRRAEIDTTLRYLDRERRDVEQNTEWIDLAAYQSRLSLLDRLISWYGTEIEQIDRALSRVKQSRYGLCLACHEPIEAERLEISPEAEFCFECQEYRERLETG